MKFVQESMSLYVSLWMIFSGYFASGIKSPDICKFTLVESIPQNLTYPPGSNISLSTYAAHKRLMSLAEKEIHLASFYWTLQKSDTKYGDSSAFEGEDIFKSLKDIVAAGKVNLMIAQNAVNADTDILNKTGAQVRTLNFTRLMHGGILHTKMWLVDNKHMYVGSANFDWRSYTQVKETGVLIEDCSELVSDVNKIFKVYWDMGAPNATVPNTWPSSYSTDINATSPLPLNYNDSKGLVYISSSPPPFCPTGRTNDIDAILQVIFAARKFVYISVMDFFPLIMYQYPERFWPVIDNALRKVAYENKVTVYFMSGCWSHTRPDMVVFLKTLNDLSSIKNVDVQVKYFTLPETPSQAKIPFARVNHSKFMVTDQHAYIGTSNWSGDYFVYTGGVGFILQAAKGQDPSHGFRQQLEDAFIRDWSSEYASPYCKKI